MAVTFTPRITRKERANQRAYPFDWFGIKPPRDLPQTKPSSENYCSGKSW